MILLPIWAGGTTEQLAGLVGPGRLIDSGKYYVIAVDALSNGVSSSPSNSRLQPRMKFPRITIRDMVETQHDLLTRVLHIAHVKAVVGVSMGGMQTFQWMVTYPGFMEKAVPILGSPRLAPYDLVHWQAQIDAIMHDAEWNNGDYTEQPAREAQLEFGAILLSTPEHYNQHTTREQVLEQLRNPEKFTTGYDANNKVRQTQAMMALDVSAPFGGHLDLAVAAVKAKVLMIVSRSDHVVTPGPALEFGRLLRAETLELDDDCGHQADNCEHAKLTEAVARFLAQ